MQVRKPTNEITAIDQHLVHMCCRHEWLKQSAEDALIKESSCNIDVFIMRLLTNISCRRHPVKRHALPICCQLYNQIKEIEIPRRTSWYNSNIVVLRKACLDTRRLCQCLKGHRSKRHDTLTKLPSAICAILHLLLAERYNTNVTLANNKTNENSNYLIHLCIP